MKIKGILVSGAAIAAAAALTFGGFALADQGSTVEPTVQPSPSVIDSTPAPTTPEPTVTAEPIAPAVPVMPAPPAPTTAPTITPPPTFGHDKPIPAAPAPMTPPPTPQPREP